jgi:hypothetical protein
MTVFTTDRRNRNINPRIFIEKNLIEKKENPKYLGVHLDTELRFTKHIEEIEKKATKKLNILRRLTGMDWGCSAQTLRTTYTSIIRPILEYASPIWGNCSNSNIEKLEKIQARACKIILGATSSTRNEDIVKEAKLSPLINRFKFSLSRIINKIKCSNGQHIGKTILENYDNIMRLKRSSPLQFYQET